jgi:undecaprenol kinase
VLEKSKPTIDSDQISNPKAPGSFVGSSDWLGLEQILKHDKQAGLFGLVRSFSHAFNGIRETFLSERNFKIQLGCAFLVLSSAALLRISLFNWLILIQVIALVLAAELINTALERLVDLAAGSLYHPLARAAKDAAAGAVLITAIFAVVSGVIIFGPYLWSLCHNGLNIAR